MTPTRTALVTGAGRGIGAAIATALDAAGHRVALVARSAPALEAIAATLTNDPVVLPADLADPEAPATVVAAALSAFGGRLDVLVNNAGQGVRKPVTEITAAEIDALFAINVRAALLTSAAAAGVMTAAGSGAIVNISSISGLRGAPWRSIYAATKAALDGMTRSMAMELGPAGVRVNSVAPGVVLTDMWEANLALEGVTEAVLGVIPTRRLSTVDEVAAVVAFLAGDAARAITGEVISADGGIHATVNLWPTV
jgi:NAD(P)-dependent dehydrogenase (short-subunit alcohol dehydrogenase family)